MEKHFKLQSIVSEALSHHNPYNNTISFNFREVSHKPTRIQISKDRLTEIGASKGMDVTHQYLAESVRDEHHKLLYQLEELRYLIRSSMKPGMNAFDLVPVVGRCDELLENIIHSFQPEKSDIKVVNQRDLVQALHGHVPMYNNSRSAINPMEREHLFRGKDRRWNIKNL